MNLEEALKEIERLKEVIQAKDEELEILRKKKNAGRPPRGASWQKTYNEFVKLYEKGLPMVEIVAKSSSSRRTCYRYKAYYESLKKEQQEKDNK